MCDSGGKAHRKHTYDGTCKKRKKAEGTVVDAPTAKKVPPDKKQATQKPFLGTEAGPGRRKTIANPVIPEQKEEKGVSVVETDPVKVADVGLSLGLLRGAKLHGSL